MIKRILNPEDFKQLIEDIDILFEFENENQGHFLLKHNKETIINSFANKHILAWDMFVWANHNGKSYDAIIMFFNDKSAKFGEQIFSEYLWLSKNPKAGYKLFQESTKFARQKGFKYIIMNRVMKHPHSHGVMNFYEKMGFIKDTETFIAEL
jgi:GNAT superfamily N-acetyltransferase